jgi:RNA polymerase sigma factor (sigma-70 family)
MAAAQLEAGVRCIRNLAANRTLNDSTDGALLRAFLDRNDQSAFEALLRRHGAMVLRLCRRLLRQEQDAEDVFQATFLTLAQQAHSIRKKESLASWLHEVAYRMATHAHRAAARRRRHESQADMGQPPDPALSAAWREIQVLLDEEIERLPETLRAAFVPCCLENKSCAEAANQLGVQEATVWKRVSRARKLLQERLSRRGVSLSAVLAGFAVGANGASAALPRSLVRPIVAAAARMVKGQPLVGGPVSSKVLTLMKGANRAMFLTKGKTAILLLVCTTIVSIGLGMAAVRQAAGTEPGARTPPTSQQGAGEGSKEAPPQPAGKEPAPAEAKEAVKVRGRVLDPDGKPFKGAKVYLNAQGQEKPPVRATTGDDGRFEFRVRRPELAGPYGGAAQAVATGDGCGADWAEVPTAGTGELTLRLVKDDVPIRGRILTLEGKPVAGARVRVQRVRAYPGGDLTPLFQAIRESKLPGEYPTPRGWQFRLPNQPKEVVCDAAGRFRLSGVGREREVELAVEGPGIQHSFFTVYTRVMEPISSPYLAPSVKHYGATFDHQALPGRTLTGVVWEKGTRKPLAGVTVSGHGTLSIVRTDAKGHYELPGCAKDKQYTLLAFPETGGSYFSASVVVPDAAGLGPLTADLELVRGIPFRGKVIDKETRKPVRGRVSYHPFHGNGNAVGMGLGYPASESAIATDGSFACVVLPGPGFVGVRVFTGDWDRYLRACVSPRELFKMFKVGTEENSPLGTRDLLFSQGGVGSPLAQSDFQAIVLVNADKDEKAIEREMILERAPKLKGSVVGPDGKPVAGARVRGLNERSDWETLVGADFTMFGPHPLRPRTLIVKHAAKELVGTLEVKGTEKGALQVRLRPWAAITGRLVDEGGKPLAGILVHSFRSSGGDKDSVPVYVPVSVPTDKDGKFRIRGQIPGSGYYLIVDGPVSIAKDLTLKAGQTTDLGEVRVGRPVKE